MLSVLVEPEVFLNADMTLSPPAAAPVLWTESPRALTGSMNSSISSHRFSVSPLLVTARLLGVSQKAGSVYWLNGPQVFCPFVGREPGASKMEVGLGTGTMTPKLPLPKRGLDADGVPTL